MFVSNEEQLLMSKKTNVSHHSEFLHKNCNCPASATWSGLQAHQPRMSTIVNSVSQRTTTECGATGVCVGSSVIMGGFPIARDDSSHDGDRVEEDVVLTIHMHHGMSSRRHNTQLRQTPPTPFDQNDPLVTVSFCCVFDSLPLGSSFLLFLRTVLLVGI